MPAKPLTKEQLADAERLARLFARWKQARKDANEEGSQEAAASILGFGQSALSQYVKGRIPLNVDAALKFSQLFSCQVSEFSPEIAREINAIATAAETPANDDIFGSLDGICRTPQEMRLLAAYRLADTKGRAAYDGVTAQVAARLAAAANKRKPSPGSGDH